MRLSILPFLLAAGAAFAQSQPAAPAAASRPELGAAPARDPAAEPPPAVRSLPSVPSRPSAVMGAGDAMQQAPSTPRERAPNALAVDPRGGGWGTPVAPQVGTGLEAVMNTGGPMGQSRMLRKVCPPGLENRDGNCVAPASAIMR